MKRGLGAGLLVCGRCKRSVASSFSDCPFCGAKMEAAPPRVPVPSREPEPAAVFELDLEPPRAPEPQPEPERAHVPAPIAALDLEIESSRLPKTDPPKVDKPAGIPTVPELELDFPKPPASPLLAEAWGAVDAPAEPPALALEVEHEREQVAPQQPTSAPAPSSAEAPGPVARSTIARASFAGPRGGLAAGARPRGTGKHPLLWAGLSLGVIALLPLACGALVTGTSRDVALGSLAGLGSTRSVRVIEGFASRSDRVELDPSRPELLKSPYDLVAKRELLGRTVEVVATPLSLAIQKRYRIGPDGRRQELDALTNIYAPVTLDQRVWVVSSPVEAKSPSDPVVVQFGSQRSYRGVVERLSSVVDIELLRSSEHEGPSTELLSTRAVPDDALAIVAYAHGSGERVLAAPIMGTQRRVWAMTDARGMPDTELYGDYVSCPAKACELVESIAPSPPAGVLNVRQNVLGALAGTVRKAGVLLLLLGIALGGTGWLLGRTRARRARVGL